MQVFYNIMEIFFTLIENFFIMYFSTKLLGFNSKINSVMRKVLPTIFFVILNGLTLLIEFFPKYEGIITILGVLIAIIYVIICLDNKVYLRIIVTIILFMIIGICGGVIIYGLVSFTNIQSDLIYSVGSIERVTVLIISHVVIYIIGIALYIKFKKVKIDLSIREWQAICVIVGAMLVEILGCHLIINDGELTQGQKILILFIEILVICISVILYFLIMKISKCNKRLLEESLIRIQLEENAKNIVDIDKYYRNLKILEHDVKHHYTIIDAMLSENKIEEAREYMANFIDKRVSTINLPIVVNSSMVNAILSSKFTECKEKNITYSSRVTGEIPQNMEMDVCIILANILDNAITASEDEDNPSIGLDIYRDKNYLNIEVYNKISKSVLDDNPELSTSKSNKDKHGIGTLSIIATVENHNGMVQYFEEDNKFISSVVLQLD